MLVGVGIEVHQAATICYVTPVLAGSKMGDSNQNVN